MQEKIQALSRDLADKIGQAKNLEEIESLRVEYLGKKGSLAALFSQIGQISPAERPQFGKWVNEAKLGATQLLDARVSELSSASLSNQYRAEALDVTLPGRRLLAGHQHPLTRVLAEILEIFRSLSFTIANGSEIETDYYNFEALHIPANHPARDMQDTFYLKTGLPSAHLLRTHTSPVQIHVMEKSQPPLRVVSGGKVYRRDDDITHSPMFHQVEGFMVDADISMADLKGLLTLFVARMFSPETKLRFRPSFFPFTEPSAEIDISCILCQAKGCRVCSNTGWLEVMGAGMIHSEVFRSVHYDVKRWRGFAFGMGVERIAMLKYGVSDIRLFFENDQRFLRQF